jgi:hypothetical protein
MNTNPLYDIEELKPFIQHGIKPLQKSGPENVVCTCIFCNKDHFYVNVKTKDWKCHSGNCGKHGGYLTWLSEVQKWSEAHFTGAVALDLCKNRSLGLGTLKRARIGYNPITREHVIPYWDMNREKVWDLRFKRKGKMWSTFGVSVGLYGWDKLALDDFRTVWICEGEWDGIAMDELMQKMKLGSDVIWVAVPGAGTFKAEWAIHFKGKVVNVVFDNDKAGRDGTIKVYNSIKTIAKELKFVHWAEKFADGFDLRDLYTKEHQSNATDTWKTLTASLKEEPPGANTGDPKAAAITVKAAPVKLDGPGLPPEEVYAAYQRHLHLPDTQVLDFMFGVVIANRTAGDPIWGQLMGPSGATKTELLITLDDAPHITTASSLTPHSLVSGANFSGGGDPSLIPRWDGKVVVIKDLTVLLSLNQTYREEIFSILRDAYDGKTERNFGNGVYRSYKSKFGMLCGVTNAIELFTEDHTALGERFLRYPVQVPTDIAGRLEISRRAMHNTTNEDVMRSELRDIGRRVLSYDYKVTPSVGTIMEEKILNLAQFTSLMRSTIKRDPFTKEITHKPFGELGTRLTKQFYKLLVHGVGAFRRVKDLGEREYSVIRRISLGTVPSRLEDIVRKAYVQDPQKARTIADYSSLMGLPQATVHRQVEALTMLGVLRRSAVSAMKPEWVFTKDIMKVIESCDLYKGEKP